MASTEVSRTPHTHLVPLPSDGTANGISGAGFEHLVLGPEIGHGGMATVCQARDFRLGRTVAIKRLTRAAALDRQAVERFQRETQILAALDHPHIVPVFAKGEVAGIPYFEMPLIRGRSLNAVLNELRDQACCGEPLTAEALGRRACRQADPHSNSAEAAVAPQKSWTASLDYFREVARLLEQVASALAYAHDRGIVHCDVKPANIMLDAEGRAWLFDFGAAHAQGEPRPLGRYTAVGTLAYSPPESLEDNVTPNASCDLYGLGATLYELLTLRPPFAADNGPSLMRQILLHAPLAPRRVNRNVPRDLEAITLRAMAKHAGDRFASMEEMRSALQRWLDLSQSSPRMPRRPNGFRAMRLRLREVFTSHRWRLARTWIAFATLLLVLIMMVIHRGFNQLATVARWRELTVGRDGGDSRYGGRAIPPALVHSASGEAVDRGIHMFRGHSYRLTSRPGSWADSEQEAVAMGGHLVTIADSAEQEFINSTFLQRRSDGQHPVYWIGLYRTEESSEYHWSSGEAVNYTNWHPGEPNDFRGAERYAAVNWHLAEDDSGDAKQGDWNDLRREGFRPLFGIIEISEGK